MIKNKAAQITVFMIIGVILLFSSALFVYTKNQMASYKPISRPSVELAPVQLRPVQNFVTSCIEQTFIKGIKKAGLHGGYTDQDDMNYNSLFFEKSESVMHNNVLIPYWSHYANGFFDSERPKLYKESEEDNSIENNIETYLENNIHECLKNLDIFSNQFDITKGLFTSTVTINQESVSAKVNFPLEIKAKGQGIETTLSKFFVDVPVRLKGLYDFATAITNKEIEEGFVENAVMRLVNDNAGLGKALPPVYDMDLFNMITDSWTKTDVKAHLQSSVLPNINMMGVVESLGFYPIEPNPLSPNADWINNVYSPFQIQLGDESFNKFRARFINPRSDIFLSLNGGREVLMSENRLMPDRSNIIQSIMGMGYDEIRTFYTMSFPVVIILEDPNAFNEQGYKFYFALESTILDNEHIQDGQTLPDEEVPEVTEQIFELNDPSLLVKRGININTYDNYTHEPLEGVDIYYKCGEEYNMGITELQSNGKSTLTTQLPFCVSGGVLIGRKTGYTTGFLKVNNLHNSNFVNLNLHLFEEKELNLKIKKRTISNLNLMDRTRNYDIDYLFHSFSLNKREDAVVFILEKTITNPFEITLPQIFLLGDLTETMEEPHNYEPTLELLENYAEDIDISDEDLEYLTEMEESIQDDYVYLEDEELEVSFEGQTISLAPGLYNLDSTLMKSGKDVLTVRKKTITICVNDDDEPIMTVFGECFGTEKDIELPELELPIWITGGALTQIQLKPEHIYERENITFYLLEVVDVPTSYDDFENLRDFDEENEKYQHLLIPLVDGVRIS